MATVGFKGLNNLNMFMFCLTWLTCSSNTNMFVVDHKQFSEITNIREHKRSLFESFNLPKSRLY